MDKLLFGAAYYDEYMPYDRIGQDMEMMKKAGFNVIRIAESTWSTLEPKEGVFDFTHVDRMLSAAYENGIAVIVGTPTYAVPSWLVKKDPTVLTENARYGPRQNMDIANPTYLHHAEIVIRRLISHVAAHPAVIGYQVDNETKYYGSASCHMQRGFKAWLMEKFGTVEAMNKAYGLAYWSNAIAGWEDFPDVSGVQNGSLGCAFEEYRRRVVTEFLAWQSRIIKEYARPHQFVTHNLDYGWESFGPEGHHDGCHKGIQADADHYDICKAALDIAGTDVYHRTQYHLDGMTIAFAGSEMYPMKNAQYLVLETQAQAFCEFVPFPGQMKLHAMAHLAAGARSILYWNWHSIHNAKETYWKGVLSHDLQENPTYLEVCEVGGELQKLSPMLLGMEKRNKVAILVDNETYSALRWFPIHKDLSYNDVISRFYRALYEMNVECDIVFAKSPDFGKYDVLIAPALYAVDETVTKALENYVAQGGTLLGTFKSFVTDKNVKVSHERLPAGMSHVFGVTYNQFVRPEWVTVEGEAAEYFMELVQPLTAQVHAIFENCPWGEYAALTENTFGRGSAWYLGYMPSLSRLKTILTRVLYAAGVPLSRYRFPIIVKKGYTQAGEVTFVMNFSMEKQRYICPRACRDLRTGTCYAPGETVILTPWDAKILADQES